VRTNPTDWVGGKWAPRDGQGSAPCLFVYTLRFNSSAVPPLGVAAAGGGGGGYSGRRVILRFEAVMSSCAVYLNGVRLGTHRGGYDDFYFRVDNVLRAVGDNVLQVGVLNDAWFHGKQFNKHFLDPGGISYSPSSGIWQTVWLEALPAAASIVSAVGGATSDLSGLLVNVTIERAGLTNTYYATAPPPASAHGARTGPEGSGGGGDSGRQLAVKLAGDFKEAAAQCSIGPTSNHCLLSIPLPSQHRRPWTPADPYLYYFNLTLLAMPCDILDSNCGWLALSYILDHNNII
jgi:hypothetical protein